MKRVIFIATLGLVLATTASAHVTVKPSSVGIGSRQVFTISVPNEKEVPNTGLRLVIPEGIQSVTPNVKAGWKIEIKTKVTGNKITDHDGMEVEETIPTEIVWSGGSIPHGQRDEFYFSTQVPASESKLAWKAYQTYADGSVVAWDQAPGTDVENPFSLISVVDDLQATSWWQDNQNNLTLGLSILALVIALATAWKKSVA